MNTYVVMHRYFVRGQGTTVESISVFDTKEQAKAYIRDTDIAVLGAVCKSTDVDFKDRFHAQSGERKITSKNYGSIYKKIDNFYISEEDGFAGESLM